MSVNVYGMPTGVQIPQATDFRQNQTASSRYRFRRVAPEGNMTALQASSAASQDVSFRFGAGYVINLAKTRLRIFEQVNSTGTTSTLTTYMRALPPIQAIRLQTSSGVNLFDIQNFDAYMSTIYPLYTKKEDVPREAKSVGISKAQVAPADLWVSPYQAATGAGTPAYVGSFGMPGSIATASPVPGFSAVATPSTAFGATTPGGPLVFPNQLVFSQASNASTAVNKASLLSVFESPNAYIDLSDCKLSYPAVEKGLPRSYLPVAVGVNSANTHQWDLPLSKLLPHTLCAQLQDLYFGTDLLLTVSLAAYGNRSFQGIGQTGVGAVDYIDGMNPVNAGTANATNPPVLVQAYTSCAATITVNTAATNDAVSVCYLQDMLLATQDNQDLVNSVKQEIAGKGIRIPIQQPFLAIESATAPAAASQNYSRTIRLNIARGAALLKWYTGFLVTRTPSGAVTGPRRMPGNMRSAVWQTYRAFLNAVPMSDSIQNAWDHFSRVAHFHKGSLCESLLAWLQISGMCVEDFLSGFDLSLTTPEGGLPLANPIDVQIDWQYGAACTCETLENVFLGVMLKYLSISPAGVTCESA